MAGGRPLEYSEKILNKAREYLTLCQDTDEQINLPTKGGLAVFLDVSRDTLYDWSSKYPEFSYIMEQLGGIQEDRLINNGLAGTYNPTIAKVLLTKHGYIDKQDVTSGGEAIGPLLVKFIDDKPSDGDTERV